MPTPTPTRNHLELTNEAQINFLRDGTQMQYLDAFISQERSLKEAADYLNVKLNVMSYWVSKMQGLGLIEETRSEKRRGRPIKYYRATSDVFTVPLSAIAHDQYLEILSGIFDVDWQTFLASMARQLMLNAEQLQLRYFRTVPSGRRISIEERQRVSGDNYDLEDGLNNWGSFSLSPEAFRRYAKEMLALQLKLIEESRRVSPQEHKQKGHKKYVFHFGLVERLP
jgi:DNA-binding MarR family transcriptional regulator